MLLHNGERQTGRRAGGVTKRFGETRRGRPSRSGRRQRRVPRPARPLGLRQDHDTADDRRLRGADRGRDRDRRRAPASASRRTSARSTRSSSYALFPHMTVLDNVAYGLKQRKVGKERARAPRRRGAVARAPRRAARSARPNQLSGGQQQRVALARALVLEPEGAAARRAARRARPEAAQGDADRAQAPAARGRHHLRRSSRTTRRRPWRWPTGSRS